VKNDAGGYVYQVDDMVRVRRMFCLGTEAGTYYKNSVDLTLENTQAVTRILQDKRGEDLVKVTSAVISMYEPLGASQRQNNQIYYSP
jgi:hypothetical protein